MNNSFVHIAILDSSHIICEGVQSILFQSEMNVKMFRLNCLEDLQELTESKLLDILIVNSLAVINRDKEIKKIRKSYPQLSLVCIELGFTQTIAQLFDASFTLYDSSDHIIHTLSSLNKRRKTNDKKDFIDDTLTDREIEVLIGLVNGLSNKEIADSLNISIHTVVSHRKNITLKTGIRSQSGLTIYAISKKIIAIDDVDLMSH